nr:unnamed protein product [Callosobruchus chinensis]
MTIEKGFGVVSDLI